MPAEAIVDADEIVRPPVMGIEEGKVAYLHWVQSKKASPPYDTALTAMLLHHHRPVDLRGAYKKGREALLDVLSPTTKKKGEVRKAQDAARRARDALMKDVGTCAELAMLVDQLATRPGTKSVFGFSTFVRKQGAAEDAERVHVVELLSSAPDFAHAFTHGLNKARARLGGALELRGGDWAYIHVVGPEGETPPAKSPRPPPNPPGPSPRR